MTDSNKKIDLAPYIDQTLLKPEATSEQIEILCLDALQYKFKGICINSRFVSLAATLLKDSNILTISVIGFPLGACLTKIKTAEAIAAVECGAQELDMVINIGALKEKNWSYVETDIREVCKSIPAPVKVILETCLLSNDEITLACKIAENAGASYVKTSTGFSTSGATLDHIKLMKISVSSLIGVKASGGIKTRDQAIQFINAGATRLGTSSGVELLKEFNSDTIISTSTY
jgi:deoxyribose-phosphate aldolase